MAKFYKCDICGNFVGMVHNSGVPMVCCGQKMTALEPNVSGASVEKHMPVAEVKGNEVFVKVGAAEHPMSEEHSIQWIFLESEMGGQRRILHPGDKAQAHFYLDDGDKAIAVWAYCNLHGLWRAAL